MHPKILTAAALALLLGPAAAQAGGQRPARDGADLSLSVSVGGAAGTSGTDALVDVGVLRASWPRGRRAPSALVQREVTVRLSSRSGRRGFVRLRASLQEPTRGAVLLDGVALTTAPRLVDMQAPIGSASLHRLEFEAAASEPAGAVSFVIVWEVEES